MINLLYSLQIESLIFWNKTRVNDELLAVTLKLLPKVSSYLGLDLWDLPEHGKQRIQKALDTLTSSVSLTYEDISKRRISNDFEFQNLKVNVYPHVILERRVLDRKRSVSPTLVSEIPTKSFKSMEEIPRRRENNLTMGEEC